MRKTTKMVAVLAAMSVMILGAATMVSADEKNGWVKEGSDWYYYVDDEAVINEWALSGSDWYFLGEEGKMEEEVFVYHSSSRKYVAGVNDVTSEDYYYVGKGGAMVTGWAEIEIDDAENTPYGDDADKAWYYFAESGLVYIDRWVLSNDLWYYVGNDGQMDDYELTADGYYVGKNGAMVTGWLKASKDDIFKTDAWVYLGTDGKPVADWKKIDGSWYYFGVASGNVVSGDAYAANLMNENTVITEGGHRFHIKKSGAMSTGWVRINSTTYYYAKPSTGVLYEDVVEKISGKFYFFADIVSKDSGYAYKVGTGDAATYTFLGTTTEYSDLAAAVAAGAVPEGATVYKLGTGASEVKE